VEEKNIEYIRRLLSILFCDFDIEDSHVIREVKPGPARSPSDLRITIDCRESRRPSGSLWVIHRLPPIAVKWSSIGVILNRPGDACRGASPRTIHVEIPRILQKNQQVMAGTKDNNFKLSEGNREGRDNSGGDEDKAHRTRALRDRIGVWV
jgi:hypothetical protein